MAAAHRDLAPRASRGLSHRRRRFPPRRRIARSPAPAVPCFCSARGLAPVGLGAGSGSGLGSGLTLGLAVLFCSRPRTGTPSLLSKRYVREPVRPVAPTTSTGRVGVSTEPACWERASDEPPRTMSLRASDEPHVTVARHSMVARHATTASEPTLPCSGPHNRPMTTWLRRLRSHAASPSAAGTYLRPRGTPYPSSRKFGVATRDIEGKSLLLSTAWRTIRCSGQNKRRDGAAGVQIRGGRPAPPPRAPPPSPPARDRSQHPSQQSLRPQPPSPPPSPSPPPLSASPPPTKLPPARCYRRGRPLLSPRLERRSWSGVRLAWPRQHAPQTLGSGPAGCWRSSSST